MTQDEQHVNLLAIFHYIAGGLTALFSCMPLLHVAIGIAILSGAFDREHAPPRAFGWFFILLPSVFILCGWTLAAFIIAAGRKLQRRVSRTFCLVVAGIECVLMPFGTVLGVFTIIVLMKDSVQELFAANRHAMNAGGDTMTSDPKRGWWRRHWKCTLPTGCLLVLLVGAGVVGGSAILLYRSFTGPAVHLDFELPASAEVLEQHAGPCDFHGDYTYCISFRLSQADLRGFQKRQFWWMVSRRPDRPDPPAASAAPPAQWTTGPLPDDVLHFMGELKVHLAKGPEPSTSYRYVVREVEGGWWRLLVVDQDSRTVYYYRKTW